MKKAIITLSVIMLTAMSAFAAGGGDTETNRYYNPTFKQGWFVDVAGTYNWFFAHGTTYSQFKNVYGHQIGVSGKIGKMLTPSLGMRVAYDLHPSTNRWYNGATSSFNLFSQKADHFCYKSLHVDVMESPLDLFLGYNPQRFFTPYIYAGAALMAADSPNHTRYLLHVFKKNGSNLELGVVGGIVNCFRLSNSFDFHIDFQSTITRWSFDDIEIESSSLWHKMHIDFLAEAGLMWRIGGRTLEEIIIPEAIETDCSAQERRIEELVEELQRCRANNNATVDDEGNVVQPSDTIVKFVEGETITYPFSIFFNKGSYDLRDGRDRVNLEEFAKVAKAKGYKVTLRGTCDSATASSAFNQTLAENRCNKIKQELVKLGVPESNITINPVGGVKELTPTEYDRRVLIQLSK